MIQKIFTEQLASHLEKGLRPAYLLVGQDPLLLDESKLALQQYASRQQFDEKVEIDVDASTNWNDLFERCQSMGLFFSRQIIVLNLPDNLTTTQNNALKELIALQHQDILLIISIAKLSKTVEKLAWYLNLGDKQAIQVSCYTPTTEQLPKWIQYRLKAMALSADNEAIQLLSYNYESNLLALKQILQQLQLLYPDGKLTFNRVKQAVEQSALFTPYQWIDAMLQGKAGRALRILNNLQQEDTQPLILVRMLQKELQILLSLSHLENGIADSRQFISIQHLRSRFDQLKIWQNRRELYTAALKRFSYRHLYLLLQELTQIEIALKRDFSADVWIRLEKISMNFCHY